MLSLLAASSVRRTLAASRKPIRACGGISAYDELSAPLGLMKSAGNAWDKHTKKETDIVRKDRYF